MKLPFVLRRVLLPFLGLFGLFMLLILIINLSVFDEQLNPEIEALMKPSPMPEEKLNAYYAIMGLSAASDKEIIPTGIELMDRYLSNREKKGIDELSDKDYLEIIGGEDLDKEWLSTFTNCNSRKTDSCLTEITTKFNAMPALSSRLNVMLSRYQKIVQMQNYQIINHTTVATPLPNYGIVIRLSQISLAQLNNSDSQQAFIKQVEVDLKFWRMILEQGSTLIDKMIAVAGIWTDLKYLSEFIQTKQLSLAELTSINALLLPLTQSELDITESFAIEAAHMYQALNDIKNNEIEELFGFSSRVMKMLIQPNATNNKHFQYLLKPVTEIGKLNKAEFYTLINSNKIDLDKSFEVSISPTSLYNLGGKLLLPASIWSPTDYIARVHDVNGMFDLVKLQLSLKNVALEDIQLSINNSDIKNPYTNAPMNFDKESHSLGFDCLDTHSLCQIRL